MLKQAFNTVFTRIFVTLILLVQSSLWTRLLAPEGRGLYSKLQTSQNLMVLVLGFGLSSGIVYFCSSRKASAGELWNLSLFVSLAGSFFAALILGAGHLWPHLDFIFPDSYRSFFFAFYIWAFLTQTQLQLAMNSILAAEHQFSKLNRIEIFSSLFRLGLILIAFVTPRDQLNLILLFSIDLTAHFLKTALYFIYFRQLNVIEKLRMPKFDLLFPVLRYSIALYSLYLIQFLYQRIDIWIIERWNGLAALGIFSSAMGLAQYLTILPIALNTVLSPHASRSNEVDAYQDLARISRINISLLILPILVFILIPIFIIQTLFGSEFVMGAFSLQILALAYGFASAKHIFIFFNAARGRLKVSFFIEILGLIVGIVCNLMWVPVYGIGGAAVAFLVTAVLTSVLSFFSVAHHAPLGLRNFFVMTRDDLRLLKNSPLAKSILTFFFATS